uniref:RNA-directed DNA polymerase, eukaryota n=1 Tax=Tanacetum cinerariifolium TaxID=118510 RepID=A0A6L2LUG7_TANCI|nr:RNA-directed DNA polymerase, eukaryota [Tanacetum cinerariifolium]
MVKDFRSISLIGSVYKIIEKILSNRLVNVLGDIVSEVQSAFVANRQILDEPFILNEVIQWCKAKKKQTLIFKVDFEKAYDSVRWDFLDDVLCKFVFGDKWRRWIQCCLKSSRGSIIINGSLTIEFEFGKGLKQGDALSPFLFILIMESLHLSFQRVVEAGLFHGVKLHDTVTLSHLLYADDAVFVGQWSQLNISTLTHVLKCFHKASGLKINMCKSEILGIHVNNDYISRAAEDLGCQMKMLSSGGRLTLVKSVLRSMPIFHMSLFKVPACILHKLESIRKHFFNGHEVSSRKISWANWNKVITPKEKGGLGVSSLYALNRGLLFKWVWRFITQGSSLWARVIKAIHGIDGSIGDIRSGNSKSCWSSIINEINVLSSKGIKLMNYLRITLGNGVFMRLWDEPWHVEGILKDRFPCIYALENCKSVTVEDKLAHQTLSHSFRTLPRGGQFSVASVRKIIDNKLCSGGENSTRWIRCVPNKINIHAWKVMTGSLATRFDISRWGIVIDSTLCGNCDIGVETTSHLFFTCDMATSVRRLINRWWEVPDMEIDSYATWKGWFVTIRMASKNKFMFGDMKRKVGNEDRDVRQTRNSKYSESLETLPIKRKVGRPKKSISANENKSSSVKRRGHPRKRNDEEKKQTIGSKGKKHKDSSKSKKKKKSKISENNRNSKIRNRTTPTALFNAMAILNDDRKKCLHEMGFGSMIGMGIHELPRKLGFYVIDNFYTETNVLSLTDSSILVTSELVNDILGIPMRGCSIESLEPRASDDPFIKEWLSQFGEKTEIRPNDISDVIVSTKDAGKLFKMNFLMLFANTMGCVKHQDFIEMILAKFKNIHYDLRSLSEELYKGLSRFPDCVKVNELNKKCQEDLCNKDLARNEDAEDANVANPSEAVNVAQASPTAQVSRAAILHASPIRMSKKAVKRTG